MPRAYRSIVVLTGAGVSAESGLQTFRAAEGLWENHRVEEVASPQGFAANPELVHRFYNERRRQLLAPSTQPNRSHAALALLEREFTSEFLLVTQNIDDLHERAGSRKLIHMHGELLKMRCITSGNVYPCEDDIETSDRCACCGRDGVLRPHVVWFGEMPLEMDRIYERLAGCDLFIAIGTSGNVYPAAGFVEIAARAGVHTVELNLEPSALGSVFEEARYGPATDIVPAYVSELLQ